MSTAEYENDRANYNSTPEELDDEFGLNSYHHEPEYTEADAHYDEQMGLLQKKKEAEANPVKATRRFINIMESDQPDIREARTLATIASNWSAQVVFSHSRRLKQTIAHDGDPTGTSDYICWLDALNDAERVDAACRKLEDLPMQATTNKTNEATSWASTTTTTSTSTPTLRA